MNFSHGSSPPSDVGHQAFAEHDGVGQAIGTIARAVVDRANSGIRIETLVGHYGKETRSPRALARVGGRRIHISGAHTTSIVASVKTVGKRFHLILSLFAIARADENRNAVVSGFSQFRIVADEGIRARSGGRIRGLRHGVHQVEHQRLFDVREYLTGPSVRIPDVVFAAVRVLGVGALEVRATEGKLPDMAHALRASRGLACGLDRRQEQAHEHSYDGDDDQQFDQCETGEGFSIVLFHCQSSPEGLAKLRRIVHRTNCTNNLPGGLKSQVGCPMTMSLDDWSATFVRRVTVKSNYLST